MVGQWGARQRSIEVRPDVLEFAFGAVLKIVPEETKRLLSFEWPSLKPSTWCIWEKYSLYLYILKLYHLETSSVLVLCWWKWRSLGAVPIQNTGKIHRKNDWYWLKFTYFSDVINVSYFFYWPAINIHAWRQSLRVLVHQFGRVLASVLALA